MHEALKGVLMAAAAAALWALAAPGGAAAEEKLVASWSFDSGKGEVARDAIGGLDGRIVGARWTEGREGSALAFEDYSILDYLQPDVSKATRVVVPHSESLNPAGSFSVKAHIYPTRAPVYYGGILEKGRGYGASYRLLILRDLRIRAALGGEGQSVTSSAPVTLNQWHQVEMKRDGDSLVLVVDGKEAGRTGGIRDAARSDRELVMGERFSGKLDGVEIRSW